MQGHDVVATPATSSPTIVAEGNTVPTAETATTSPMDTLPKMTGPNNPQSNETIITPDPKNYHIDVTKSPGDEHRLSLEGGPKSGKEQGSPAQGRGEVHASPPQAAELAAHLKSPIATSSAAAVQRTPQAAGAHGIGVKSKTTYRLRDWSN